MTVERAIRLAQKWAEGGVCTLREGEAQEYHKLCLKALRSKKELVEENTRFKRRIEELEDRCQTATIPQYGQTVMVQFEKNAIIGTLEIGNETCKVYLGEIRAEQSGCGLEGHLGKDYCAPGRIVRQFVLVEA